VEAGLYPQDSGEPASGCDTTSDGVPRSGSARRDSLGVRMNSVKPALLLSFSQREVWLRADQASSVSEAPTRKLQAFQGALRRWGLRGWREPGLRRGPVVADRGLSSGKDTRGSMPDRGSRGFASDVASACGPDAANARLRQCHFKTQCTSSMTSIPDRKVRSARAKTADSRRVKGAAWE
jgi:hypothetical protein